MPVFSSLRLLALGGYRGTLVMRKTAVGRKGRVVRRYRLSRQVQAITLRTLKEDNSPKRMSPNPTLMHCFYIA